MQQLTVSLQSIHPLWLGIIENTPYRCNSIYLPSYIKHIRIVMGTLFILAKPCKVLECHGNKHLVVSLRRRPSVERDWGAKSWVESDSSTYLVFIFAQILNLVLFQFSQWYVAYVFVSESQQKTNCTLKWSSLKRVYWKGSFQGCRENKGSHRDNTRLAKV